MATAPLRKNFGNDADSGGAGRAAVKQRVRFESGLPDGSSSDAEEHSSPGEEEKMSAEQRPSSHHGISSRIHKRKMPVRRPTAYVSDKGATEEKEDDEDDDKEQETPSQDIPKKSPSLDQRLRELSMKYRQQECSPERAEAITRTKGTKASCGS
ncbi:hypothetical protein Y032_0158g3239 [Ancylostoma ceylanicum]|uniref:Uncharacterized protein n=1 Tax=Ancylostoma ceylanicum TaxID=53326 RepID=A0A016SYW9_9BILA|nr:hypothetical protein Y032_0158g3239 [Ancylostoma ceylanicum]